MLKLNLVLWQHFEQERSLVKENIVCWNRSDLSMCFRPKLANFSFPNYSSARNDDDRNLYGYNYSTVMCDNKYEN